MAERVPLNRYKRVTTSLTRVASAVYTVPPDRASIIINALVNNNTNEYRTITVALSGNLNNQIILNSLPLEKRDVINIFPKKLILTEQDTLIVSTNFGNIVTLEDINAFWEFDTPIYITQVTNVGFGFSLSTQITADWDNNTALVPLTSFVPNNFSYDFTEVVMGVNINFSILEANNLPK